jgi:hypothetical protein
MGDVYRADDDPVNLLLLHPPIALVSSLPLPADANPMGMVQDDDCLAGYGDWPNSWPNTWPNAVGYGCGQLTASIVVANGPAPFKMTVSPLGIWTSAGFMIGQFRDPQGHAVAASDYGVKSSYFLGKGDFVMQAFAVIEADGARYGGVMTWRGDATRYKPKMGTVVVRSWIDVSFHTMLGTDANDLPILATDDAGSLHIEDALVDFYSLQQGGGPLLFEHVAIGMLYQN